MSNSYHANIAASNSASQHVSDWAAYKHKLQSVQLFAHLERRLQGRKKIADEFSVYLLGE